MMCVCMCVAIVDLTVCVPTTGTLLQSRESMETAGNRLKT